ncbi:hypothetical protein XENTR_v10022488 [Xenopus tropicalis]|nr:hypothetical protein XENTR_v10022488 [Xenopus tropicalis]
MAGQIGAAASVMACERKGAAGSVMACERKGAGHERHRGYGRTEGEGWLYRGSWELGRQGHVRDTPLASPAPPPPHGCAITASLL